MSSRICLGIDLGSATAKAGFLDSQFGSCVLRTTREEDQLPAAVLLDSGSVLVGSDAKKLAQEHFDSYLDRLKSELGRPVIARTINGQKPRPELLVSYVLRKWKDEAQRQLGTDIHCVLSVPAHYNALRRQAMCDAAELAGLPLLGLINEPTAIAVAYGELHGYFDPALKPKPPQTIVVIDFGAGKFEAGLYRIDRADVRTLAVDGELHLGARDWDLRLAEHLNQHVQKQRSVNPRADARAWAALTHTAELAKLNLSKQPYTAMILPFGRSGLPLKITHENFEKLTADLLQRVAGLVQRLVDNSQVPREQIDRVVLSGGGCQMPSAARRLESCIGRPVERTLDPFEAVSRGAAIYAGTLLARRLGHDPRVRVADLNTCSLGIAGLNPQTLSRQNFVLIPRNAPLPAEKRERFCTSKPDQRSIVLQVLQGESRSAENCVPIAKAVLRDLPPGLPQGAAIDVLYRLQESGRLEVQAEVPGTNRQMTIVLERPDGAAKANVTTREGTITPPPPTELPTEHDPNRYLYDEATPAQSLAENAMAGVLGRK